MRGAGFLAIWSDVERSNLTDYRHWLTREHTTERVTTDGFLANRVFRADRSDIERFFILYELQTPEVLDGPAYLARLNAPTPWSQRIMPQLGNFMRGGGAVIARAGRGEGCTIVALRLERLPESPKRLADDIAALDGIAAVQIGATALFIRLRAEPAAKRHFFPQSGRMIRRHALPADLPREEAAHRERLIADKLGR